MPDLRAARPSSAQLEVVVTDPVVDGAPPGWDDAVRAWRLPAYWLAAPLVAAAWGSNTSLWLALVSDRGGTAHGLFVARFINPGGARRFAAGRRLPPAGLVEFKLAPMGAQSGVALAPGLDPAAGAAAVHAVERALRRRLGPRLVAVAYRHVGVEVADVLRLAGHARRLSSTSDMTLVNPGTGREGYLATLPSKWRSQLRRIHATVEAPDRPGGQVTVSVDDAVPGARASMLIDIVRFRHQPAWYVRPPVPGTYLDALGALPGTRFVTYRDTGGTLIALSIVHTEGDGLAMTYWGSTGEERDLYFDQYLRIIHLMIDEDRAYLRMGKGMNDIKARYGAEPDRQWTVVGAL